MKSIFQILVVLFTLTACGEIDFKGQDVRITHDAKADTIELDIIYHSVMARAAHDEESKKTWGHRESEDLRKAVASIEELAKGAKRFIPLDPFFVIDLDERAKMLRTELDGEGAEDAKRFLRMIERITIEEVQVSKDARGRIQLHQRIQFKGAKQFTASLNQYMRDGLLLWTEEEGSFLEDTPQMLDLETRKTWIKEAQQGADWLSWHGPTLVVSVPMSPGSVARLLHATYREVAKEENEYARLGMAAMLSLISEFNTNDGRLTIRLNPNEQAALKFSIPEDDREYATSLVEALEAKGFPFD